MSNEIKRLSFSEIPYERPVLEDLLTVTRRSRLMLRLAINPTGAARALEDFDAALAEWRSLAAIVQIRHDQAIGDPFYLKEQAFFDENNAQVQNLERDIYDALSKNRHGAALSERYGSMLMQRAQQARHLTSPEVTGLIAEENRLASECMNLKSEAEVDFNGRFLNLEQMEPYLQDPDREIRRGAHAAVSSFYAARAESFDELFDRLVHTRTEIAQKLGFPSFTELGYLRMERFDYGRAEVEAFRELIVSYIVPVATEIRRLQRRRLGVERLYHYDLPCLAPQGNPVNKVAPAQLAQTAGKVFRLLFDKSPSFLYSLDRRRFMDLEARPGKAGGGYCETIHSAELPFIFMNASSTHEDVTTLMHECGHAYASIASLSERRLTVLHQPSLDICELHSTAMEYLTYPYMDQFFGEEAEAYTLLHMSQSLLFLPYACLVDEFQHHVYDQPELSPEARNELWRELERKYQPELEYREDEHFASGRAWQKKEHIFAAPFYYIDYALAQIGALQFWIQARRKPKKVLEKYSALCAAGGELTFNELLELAGLESPFKPAAFKRVAYQASSFLDL